MTALLSNPRKGFSVAQSAAVNAALTTTVLVAGTGKTTAIVHQRLKSLMV